MDLQRRQLASQQSVIVGAVTRNQRRDQLLDGQLRELEQRARTFDRQQAEAIGLEPGSTSRPIPGFDPSAKNVIYAADVVNGSRRPIRNVARRINTTPRDDRKKAHLAGIYSEFPPSPLSPHGAVPSRALMNPAEAPRIPLMRAGETGSFIFTVVVGQHRSAYDGPIHRRCRPALADRPRPAPGAARQPRRLVASGPSPGKRRLPHGPDDPATPATAKPPMTPSSIDMRA